MSEAAAGVSPTAGNGTERRDGARFSLIIRAAKLTCSSGEFLCILRDISSTGVRMRLFHTPPLDTDLVLELANGARYPLDLVWTKDEEAGFRFKEPIDVREFLREPSRFPKRPIRLKLSHPAMIAAHGIILPATIRNLSRNGALIETDMPLAIDQYARLAAQGLPEIEACVRWRNRPCHGLAFRQVLDHQDLARRVAALQLGSSAISNWPAPVFQTAGYA